MTKFILIKTLVIALVVFGAALVFSASTAQAQGPATPTITTGSASPFTASPAYDTTGNLAAQANGAVPSTASSTIAGYDAIHNQNFANDGRYGNGSSWIGTDPNSWLKIDLGSRKTIDTIQFGRDRLGTFDDRDPGRFKIEIATTDGAFTEIVDSAALGFSGNIIGEETVRVRFDPVDARFVRLTFANAGTGIDEVEIFSLAPVIALTGANPQIVKLGASYTELGATATDNVGGDISANIVTNASAVTTAALGSYTVTYDVSDAAGNAALRVSRIVQVVDTTAPIIALTGANPQIVEFGARYTELGATATDDADGDISAHIVINASAVTTAALGSYTVTYDVSDAAGNAALPVSRIVQVVDTTAPVIALSGANPQIVELGASDTELGAMATDNVDGDISANIVTNASAVTTAALGSYTVTYDVSDAAGNAALRVSRIVQVVDTTAPIIALTGANPQIVELGASYTELGATATDNVGGDISAHIVTNASAVTTAALGSYTVTYDVSDAAGNAALRVSRIVQVVDTTAPVIALSGANPQIVELGASYTELGAMATDNVDGDISAHIVTNACAVTTAALGSYTVTYDVSDAAGNAAAQISRTVVVLAPNQISCESISGTWNAHTSTCSISGSDVTSTSNSVVIPVGGIFYAGLWVGEVIVDAVTSIVEDGAPTRPAAGSAPMRILLHSDANGAVQLLSQIILMQTKTAHPEVVLVLDPSRIPLFEGIKERNGKRVGIRLESVAYDMPRKIDATSQAALLADKMFPDLTEEGIPDFLIGRANRPPSLAEVYHLSWPMDGAVGAGETLHTTEPLNLDPFHRSNPFRHAFHKQHARGPNINREIEIVFGPGQAISDRLRGSFRETLQGLIKTDLTLTGCVELRRVSRVATAKAIP